VSITKVVVLLTRNLAKLSFNFLNFLWFSTDFTSSGNLDILLKLHFCTEPLRSLGSLQKSPRFALRPSKRLGTLQCSPRAPAGGSPAKFGQTGGRDRPGAGGERPSGPWGSIPVLGLGRGVTGEHARRSSAAMAVGPRAPAKRRPMRAGLRPGHRR
jgi:hypothetical protein